MMRPVLTAAEYRNLRNSNYQKRLVAGIRKGDAKQKMRLLQMNYSCMPSNAAASNAAASNAAAGNAAAGNAAAGNAAAGNAAAGNAATGNAAASNATTPSLQKAPLKGCKSPSMSVGMDVDFDPSVPDYEEMMEKAPEMVLSKKEELGLLMLERSARKGYHLVFRRHFMDGLAEGKILENQEINLKWASELLGVKFDEAAKDITRVFFSTTASEEDLLFLDDALFEQTAPNIENLAASGNSASGSSTNGSAANGSSTSRSAAGKENPSNSAEASQKSADAQQASNAQNPANAQQASTQQASNAQNPADAQQASNAQNPANAQQTSTQQASNAQNPANAQQASNAQNLANAQQTSNTQQASNAQNPADASNISPLYNGIPYSEIISKYWELYNFGKLPTMGDRNVKTFELAVTLRAICNYSLPQLEAVIPRYDNFPEQEWRTTLESALKEPRKGMPYRLRQVLLAIQSDSKIAATGGSRDVPPAMPQKLPKLLKLLSSKVPQMYKPAVCEAIFPALAIHLHGVKFRYWDNVDHEPTFMNVLIAPMSVGKGAIKKPIDFILADIKEADKPNRLREAEWKRKNPSGKTKAKDPRPNDICIQILIDNLTDAVFNQRVVDAHENGHRFVYTRVDEVEQLKKVTSRGTVDEVSILIRKAFDNAEHGQERVGADSITGIAPLRWNFNASTTIPNAHRFFLKSVNDGTLSRLNLSTIIKPRLEDAQENSQASSQQSPDDSLPIFGIYDDKFAQDLKPYLDRLSSASGLIECPQALKLAKELTRENDKRASLYESEAYRILSYRANVIAYLKAMVLYVAQGYHWSEDIAEYVRWSEQMDLWCKMRFFGTQLEEEILQEVKQINASPQNLLSTLPDEFTYEQFLRHRQQQGKCGDGKNTLRTWKHRGYVVYDEITKTWHKK